MAGNIGIKKKLLIICRYHVHICGKHKNCDTILKAIHRLLYVIMSCVGWLGGE